MSTLAQFTGGGIKSIQYGSINVPNSTSPPYNATVSAVTIGKTVLMHLGSHTAGTSPADVNFALVLTNSTTVTAVRAAGAAAVVYFCLVEYY